MSIVDWIGETGAHLRRHGIVDGCKQSARDFHYGAMRRLDRGLHSTGLNPGRHVLNEEWDALVILDGCRFDLMDEVHPDYPYISSIRPFTSLAGGSLSWMHRTFDDDRDLSDVGYVTANPFSAEALTPARFGAFDEVWRYAWDDDVGTVRASDVTESAIDVGRSTDVDRLIVHYMQPHHPFVPDPIAAGINKDDPTEHGKTVWEMLRDGELSRSDAWSGYRENLRYVLDDVERLLTNVDAPQTVLTADHGNALGEQWIHGHGDYPIPALRRVPWCEATARDEETINPEIERAHVETDIEDQLRDLGYR